jgi:hypothetical protein
MILLLLLFGVGIPNPEREVRVDLIELNHRYIVEGKHYFSQILLWERLPQNGRYISRGFAVDRDFLQWPLTQNGITTVKIERGGSCVTIRARLYRESWTMNDPETASKKYQQKLGIALINLLNENERKPPNDEDELQP